MKEEVYKVKVYVKHGYFEYEVKDMAAAVAHGMAIMDTGVYRRANKDDSMEFYQAYKVKIVGPGLKSEYPDVFKRT